MFINEMPVVRIFEAIRRIGYTPTSAILDIVDNSVSAEAKIIKIIIETKSNPAKPAKDIITDIVITDDGKGMSGDAMLNALTLGSPNSSYDNRSLSKFGFGLKSAGLSQANKISLISKTAESGEWVKYVLDWDIVRSKNAYFIATNENIDDYEKNLIAGYTNKSIGTIVRLTNIMQINDSASATVIKNLKDECGLTYHRFIEREQLSMYVNDELVGAFDPLFLQEANKSISEYDGSQPCRYFVEPQILPLNPSSNTTMTVNAVQLPYPPMFSAEGRQKEIQSKYRMFLRNIGFYIYRNDRLICKGEKLNLVASDQDNMSFRASIDLDETSDFDVNLDVSKSKIIFPNYAFDSLSERINPVIRKSKDIWNTMKTKKDDPLVSESERTHERSNKLLNNTQPIIVDPVKGEIKPTGHSVKKEQVSIKEQYKENPDFLNKLKGKKKRIVPVDELKNSQLWKPDLDDNGDVVVYISRSHPFYEHIYKKLETGDDALVILDALFLNLSMSEMSIVATDTSLEKMFGLLRTTTSVQLSRFIEVSLDGDE